MQATPLPAWPLATAVAAQRGPRGPGPDASGPGDGPGFGEQLQAARRERPPSGAQGAGAGPGAPRQAPSGRPSGARSPEGARVQGAADAKDSADAAADVERADENEASARPGRRAGGRQPAGAAAGDAAEPGGPPAATVETPAEQMLRTMKLRGGTGAQESGSDLTEGAGAPAGALDGTKGSGGRLAGSSRAAGGGGGGVTAANSLRTAQDAALDSAQAAAHDAHEAREAEALEAAGRAAGSQPAAPQTPSATGASGTIGLAAAAGSGAPAALGASFGAASGPGATAPGQPAAAAEPPTFMLSPPLDSPTFAPALGLQLSVLARDGIEQARMQLNPESMGPISVQLSVAGNQVNVDFVASLAPTREALQQSMPELASAMRDAGFTLTGGGVFQQARDGAPGERAPAPGRSGLPGAGSGGPDAQADGDKLARARLVAPRGLVDVYA